MAFYFYSMDGFLALSLSKIYLAFGFMSFFIFFIFYYHIVITYYSSYSTLVGPARTGLTFARASSARPSRQLGFPTVALSSLDYSSYPFDLCITAKIQKMTLLLKAKNCTGLHLLKSHTVVIFFNVL